MGVFLESRAMPGTRAVDQTLEAVVGFGKVEQLILSHGVILGSSRYNDGSTNQIVLPTGLLVGGPVSGKLKQWDPTDTTGYQKLFGILLHDQRMTDRAAADVDRQAAPIAIGGPVKPSELYVSGYAKGLSVSGATRAYGLAARAALTQTGRFILDDELAGAPYGAWIGWPVAKTADYTVLEADNNTWFSNLGATDRVRFTLPAVAGGYHFGFFDAAGVGIDIAAATGTPILGLGDATRDEVSLAPVIGTFVEIFGISATQYFVKLTPAAGDGAGALGSLASDRFRLDWVAGKYGIPGIDADLEVTTADDTNDGAIVALLVTAIATDKEFEVLGTNASSDDVTLNPEGGITMETDGASNDQVLLVPHITNPVSPWMGVTWGTDQEVSWECKIKTGAAISDQAIVAGLKLSNTPTIATDADQAAFYYRTDHGTITANWVCVTSGAAIGADDGVDSGVALAINTDYHLRITIDAGRVARFYINGQLVETSDALDDITDLIPYIGIEDVGAGAAKTLIVRGQSISRNAA